MNLNNMSDEAIKQFGMKADHATEILLKAATTGDIGVYYATVYGAVYAVVLQNMLQ